MVDKWLLSDKADHKNLAVFIKAVLKHKDNIHKSKSLTMLVSASNQF